MILRRSIFIAKLSINKETMTETPLTLNLAEAQKKWRLIIAQFRAEYGETSYRQWLGGVILGAINGLDLTLVCENALTQDYIENQYGVWLNTRWRAENKNQGQIIISWQANPEKPIITPVITDEAEKKSKPKKIGQ